MWLDHSSTSKYIKSMGNLTEEIIEQGLSDHFYDVLSTKASWPDLFPLFSRIYFLRLETMALRLHFRNLFHHHLTQVRQIENLSKTLKIRKYGMLICTLALRMLAPENLLFWNTAKYGVDNGLSENSFSDFGLNFFCAIIFVGCFVWEQRQLTPPWTCEFYKSRTNLETWITVLLSCYLALPVSQHKLGDHPLTDFQRLDKHLKEVSISNSSELARALILNRFDTCAKNLNFGHMHALESYRDKLPFIELLAFIACLGVSFGDIVQ
jgi:hypothetical protein